MAWTDCTSLSCVGGRLNTITDVVPRLVPTHRAGQTTLAESKQATQLVRMLSFATRNFKCN